MVETCPHCGYALRQHGFASAVQAIASMVGVSPQKAAQNGNGHLRQPIIERTEPVGSPTMEGNYLVPTAQALTLGAAVVIFGSAGAHWAQWPFWLNFGLASGSAVTVLCWWRQTDHYDSLLQRTEKIFDKDLDGDGHVGPPPVHPIREFFTPTGKVAKGEYISRDIPWASWAEGNAVAIAVLHSGVPFSRRKLTDAGALPDDPEHYTDLFNAMIAAAYLTPHGNGGKLTDLGRWYLAQFLPPPLRRNVT